jgi:NAD(P)-dependent dehydrogenase (short-subunit alcohol dehydrogenase family)
MSLEEKVALVTGGAVRVGRAIVRSLAQAGCDVVIHYRDSAAEATSLAAELQAIGRQAWLVQGDLAEEDEPEAILRAAWDMAGWVDILVNNASTYTRQTLADAEPSDFETHWRVNALAPMLLAKTFADFVRSSEILPADYLGHVVNILDRRIAAPEGGSLPYWVSKQALAAFTLGAAVELAPRIAVNGIAPGPVLAPSGVAARGELAGDMPLTTRARPEDVGSAVVYLATSRCLTGQTLFVDSGQHLVRTSA